VILDMHNYGAYYLSDGARGVRRPIGSASVRAAHFADAWRRIATAFVDEGAVVAYGLMNEPVEMEAPGARGARAWEHASRAAVKAIRSTGDRRLVMVPGYLWSAAQAWAGQHPFPWIWDPAGNIRYEAHHYWDLDHSSRYRRSYAQEVRALGAPRRIELGNGRPASADRP
jgi:endoglucanase